MKKRSDTEKVKKMTIEETCQLYKKHATEAKTATKQAEPYKKDIIAFAKEHARDFNGKTLALPADMRVESRVKTEAKWKPELLDYDWLGDAIDAGLGGIIKVSIDVSEVPSILTPRQSKLLAQIKYETEEKESFAVYV